MSSTSSASVAVPYPSRAGRQGLTCAALVAIGALGLLLASTRTAEAQASLPQRHSWELLVSSGALVPTGAQRGVLKDAALTAAQVAYVIRSRFALTATLGWARSRDLASAGGPKVDIFSYDLGAEARVPRWFAGDRVTFSPFVGAGVGARSYNYRNLELDATHNVAGYGTVGGELGMGRVRLRLEVRDYVAGFKPLAGGGTANTRNDVVIMAGLRFDRQRARRTNESR
jgi:hypothetical protein